MPQPISEEQFTELLAPRFASDAERDRALTVFRGYGPALSFDVMNVLLHAADQNKVDAVLIALETHWNEHLKYQHPKIRGQVVGFSGNPTARMFHTICTETLGLQPSPA